MDEPIVKEELVIEAPQTVEAVAEPVAPKPGEKTDPSLLLKSLQEERAEVKRLRDELAARESASENTGVAFSEEGKLLEGQIKELQGKLASSERKERLSAVFSTFPAIKDKEQEFNDFLNSPENTGMRLETAAKAFLVENDLLVKPVVRKGLEKETGGTRAPLQQGMTPEEIDSLRVNNYNEYARRVRSGTLK